MNDTVLIGEQAHFLNDIVETNSASDILVLLVDDTVDNLVLISLLLQQNGYRVVTASNGEEGVQAALLAHPDVVLLDIGMPQMDGLAAARKIKEHQSLRDTPIIAITAFGTDGFRRAAYDAGFDGYLTKPLDFERLDTLIRSSVQDDEPLTFES